MTQSAEIRVMQTYGDQGSANPFNPDGELSQTADYILSHSTISKSVLRISDPDIPKTLQKPNANANATPVEPLLVADASSPVLASSPPLHSPSNGNDTKKGSMEGKVVAAETASPTPQEAEPVQLKSGKKNCCTII